MLYWEIGEQIRAYVLNDKRADYGKQVINQLSQQMTREFGKGLGGSAPATLSSHRGDFS